MRDFIKRIYVVNSGRELIAVIMIDNNCNGLLDFCKKNYPGCSFMTENMNFYPSNCIEFHDFRHNLLCPTEIK